MLDRCLTGGTASAGDLLREARPSAPDVSIDRDSAHERDGGIGKVGYQINFKRMFFQYQLPLSNQETDPEQTCAEQPNVKLREVAQ